MLYLFMLKSGSIVTCMFGEQVKFLLEMMAYGRVIYHLVLPIIVHLIYGSSYSVVADFVTCHRFVYLGFRVCVPMHSILYPNLNPMPTSYLHFCGTVRNGLAIVCCMVYG